RVGGADAATASLGTTDVPAQGSATATLTFRFDPLTLGPALAAQVQAASAGVGTLSFALVGGWSLDAPGLAGLVLEPANLLQEALRWSGPRPEALAPRSSRARGPGSHQFQRPARVIRAGTSARRTRVASRTTATLKPRPSMRISSTWLNRNSANTVTMTAAALVMTPPVAASAVATASWSLRPATCASRIRATRKTS